MLGWKESENLSGNNYDRYEDLSTFVLLPNYWNLKAEIYQVQGLLIIAR